jgi:hypothetical protein
MVTGWQWRVLAALALSVLALAVVACGESGDSGGSSGSTSDSGGTKTHSETPEADAGDPIDGPKADAEPNLGGDVAFFELPDPDKDAMTPQQAADFVLESGLAFSGGTEHDPAYVRCAGKEESGSGDEASFGALDCYIEVPDVAPYRVTLTVANDGKAKAEFDGVAN